MEALTLSSPMIIMVVGLPGAGKSFFAEQFANTFGAALVSRDKIRWTLFAKHTYSDNEESIVDQVSDLMITELLRTRKTFILDGGYNTIVTRTNLVRRAKKNGFRVLTIVVQTDEPTSRRRATKRSSKKPGDKYKQSLTPETFNQAVVEYQEPVTDQPDVVVISGKHTYNTQAKIVLRKMIDAGNNVAENKPQQGSRVTIDIKPRGPFVR